MLQTYFVFILTFLPLVILSVAKNLVSILSPLFFPVIPAEAGIQVVWVRRSFDTHFS